MCFHIFKYVRQHTPHGTQIGISSLSHSEHGTFFGKMPSFYMISCTFMTELWCRNTGEAVDLKTFPLGPGTYDLWDPKLRGIQKKRL